VWRKSKGNERRRGGIGKQSNVAAAAWRRKAISQVNMASKAKIGMAYRRNAGGANLAA